MKDTAQLNPFAVYGLEKFLGKDERVEIFRSMPGASSMLPKGGNAVWGNDTWAPDDHKGQKVSYGTFINFKESNSTQSPRNLTVAESLEYLLKHSDSWYKDQIDDNYSHGVAHSSAEVETVSHLLLLVLVFVLMLLPLLLELPTTARLRGARLEY